MSSRDLVLRTLDRQPTDRVPVGPMMMDLGAAVIDAPIGRFCSDPDLMARGQLALYEQIGQDIIFIGCDNYYIAEGFGCVDRAARRRDPAPREPPLERIGDVGDLEVPDPLTDGRMPVMLEATRLVRQAVGDEVAIRTPGTGPFALASYFIGTQEFLIEIGMANAGMAESEPRRSTTPSTSPPTR